MKDYQINIVQIEELQTIRDLHQLERIFQRAKSTLVNGEKVILVRKGKEGPGDKFDEFSTLDELEQFRNRVFRYL